MTGMLVGFVVMGAIIFVVGCWRIFNDKPLAPQYWAMATLAISYTVFTFLAKIAGARP